MRARLVLAIVASALLLTGCASQSDTDLARLACERFHEGFMLGLAEADPDRSSSFARDEIREACSLRLAELGEAEFIEVYLTD